MPKVRVYELAREIGVESKKILATLWEMGEVAPSASSTLEAPVVRRVIEKLHGSTPPPASQVAPSSAPSATDAPSQTSSVSTGLPRHAADRTGDSPQSRTPGASTAARRTTDMAPSNRDRIDRMFQMVSPALDLYISSIVGREDQALSATWTKLVQAKDAKNGAPATKVYDPLDPQVQFRMLTEKSITSSHRRGWYPFTDSLGRTGERLASELREVRNAWAHNGSFTDDDTYRALDTGERLLRIVGATAEADKVRISRINL